MYTGPQRPDGGRGRLLLYGGITFALVFLLIVGATVAFLVVRNLTSAGGDDTTDPVTSQTTTEATTDEGPTTEASVAEEYCWAVESPERVSQNPGGKLRGGNLQFVPPAGFTERSNQTFWAYTDDPQMASDPVGGDVSWQSTMMVASLHWQDGIEYPGAETASMEILDCIVAAPVWSLATSRTLEDVVHEPVTIDGVEGWKATGTLAFGESDIPGVTAAGLYVYVLDTPGGPSVFAADISIGVPEHEAAIGPAVESLDVVD